MKKSIRGVILAGGLGRRLGRCTDVTNKHLLPIWNLPMIAYPLRSMIEAGIKDVLIVVGAKNPGGFMQLLGDGKDLGFDSLHYVFQRGEGGIGAALSCAQDYCEGHTICVILGDNIVEKSIKPHIDKFMNSTKRASILLASVPDPERFGVAKFDANQNIIEIVEKPKDPPSSLIATGVYLFDWTVFDTMKNIPPSSRGEQEITDILNQYILSGLLDYSEIDGWWMDAGSIESLHEASQRVYETWFSPSSVEKFWDPIEKWAEIR